MNISKIFLFIHRFFVSDVVIILKINWLILILDNFNCQHWSDLSKWKTKFILSEKQIESGSKNALPAICAKWDLICYPFKYYAITKPWTGKNILCYLWPKLYCAGGCNEKKYLSVIHGIYRYHGIWNMKRFKYTVRQWDPKRRTCIIG